MSQYYSQFGADKYLDEKYFHGRGGGFYVDIGAHDGVSGSTTYFFEQLGWQGICFEPMPKAFLMLSQNRSCIKVEKAIADFEGDTAFLDISGYSEQLSGLVMNYSQEHISRIHKEVKEHNQKTNTIAVKCGLFNKEVPYKHIDILSVDTEGSEASIIKSIDFNNYNIKFIIAEFNYGDRDLVNYLNSRGYEIETQLGVDIIFKHI